MKIHNPILYFKTSYRDSDGSSTSDGSKELLYLLSIANYGPFCVFDVHENKISKLEITLCKSLVFSKMIFFQKFFSSKTFLEKSCNSFLQEGPKCTLRSIFDIISSNFVLCSFVDMAEKRGFLDFYT